MPEDKGETEGQRGDAAPEPKPGTSGAEKADSQDKQKDKPDSGKNEDG